MPYCTECGTESTNASRFCKRCGKKFPSARSPKSQPQSNFEEDVEDRHFAEATAQTTSTSASGISLISIVVATGWLLYSGGLLEPIFRGVTLNERFISRAISQADWISAILIVGMPFAIAKFQSQLDDLFIPVYRLISNFPERSVAMIGFLMPIIVSVILYYVIGLREYPFANFAIFFGILASYLTARAQYVIRTLA